MIVSVHLPKTAGSSFLAVLEAGYKDGLLLDYDDRPLWHSNIHARASALFRLVKLSFARNITQYECVHGHFLPVKYRGLQLRRRLSFVTWMRDPVERSISHYHYWRRSYNAQNAPDLQRRLCEEEWTLERFCEEKTMQDVYSRFLWGVKLERFAFVGIVEDAARSYDLFYRMWPIERIQTPFKRVNPERTGGSYDVPQSTRKYIESANREDLKLYQKARSINRKLRVDHGL